MSKIVIEELVRDYIDVNNEEIEWYCFFGAPKLGIRIEAGTNNKTTLYNEKLDIIYDTLSNADESVNRFSDKLIKQTYELSKKLACHTNSYYKENTDKEIKKTKQHNFADYINQTFDLCKKFKFGEDKEEEIDVIEKSNSIEDLRGNPQDKGKKTDYHGIRNNDIHRNDTKPFNFVRVDWLVYQNEIYFEELTFTPYSGFNKDLNPNFNKFLGKFI